MQCRQHRVQQHPDDVKGDFCGRSPEHLARLDGRDGGSCRQDRVEGEALSLPYRIPPDRERCERREQGENGRQGAGVPGNGEDRERRY